MSQSETTEFRIEMGGVLWITLYAFKDSGSQFTRTAGRTVNGQRVTIRWAKLDFVPFVVKLDHSSLAGYQTWDDLNKSIRIHENLAPDEQHKLFKKILTSRDAVSKMIALFGIVEVNCRVENTLHAKKEQKSVADQSKTKNSHGMNEVNELHRNLYISRRADLHEIDCIGCQYKQQRHQCDSQSLWWKSAGEIAIVFGLTTDSAEKMVVEKRTHKPIALWVQTKSTSKHFCFFYFN